MGRHTYAVLLLILFTSLTVKSQDSGKLTRQEYIDTYSDLAMKEMHRVGIPASITLSQGCLESDNGNSSLSVKGNNHFGIKCHDWQGGKMYHDDDEKNECFRKYKSSYESYVDHSLFLTTKSRYEFLFDMRPGDYKAWAKGLQKAGYATSNKYSSLLIKIIEENDLQAYDKMVLSGAFKPSDKTGDKTGGRTESRRSRAQHGERPSRRESETITTRKIYKNNRIDYIIVEQGDTPARLREELDLYPNEIYRYNDLEKTVALDSGMVIYLQPKRLLAEKGFEKHIVEEGETMRSISQKYGVKIGSLYKMNNLKDPSEPEIGAELNLRRKVKVDKKPLLKQGEEEEEVPVMEFEFDGS